MNTERHLKLNLFAVNLKRSQFSIIKYYENQIKIIRTMYTYNSDISVVCTVPFRVVWATTVKTNFAY